MMPTEISEIFLLVTKYLSENWKGLVGGGFLWEMVRKIFLHFWSRHLKRKNHIYSLILKDLSNIKSKVDPLVKSADIYYSQPSYVNLKLPEEIRREFKVFATDWNSIGVQLKEKCGKGALENKYLINFRQSLTMQLDVSRDTSLPDDHQTRIAIWEAGSEIKRYIQDKEMDLGGV